MSSDESLYRAPESSLDRPVRGTARSLDAAMAGDWDFDFGEVLSEAWRLTNGSKGVIWLGAAITLGANMVFQGLNAFAAESGSSLLYLLLAVAYIGSLVVGYAVNGGTTLYAVKRAAGDETASFDDVLKGFTMILPILGVLLLYGLLSMVGLLLFVIPGIYVMVACVLALPLKVERGLGVWESIQTSRKAVHHRWFKVAALLFVTALAVGFGSILTLGIGAIWLIPYFSLVYGVLYREAFGYSGAA